MKTTVYTNRQVACIICRQPVLSTAATAGSLYADGSQAFACSGHVTERLVWNLAWITFETIERHKQIRAAAEEVV